MKMKGLKVLSNFEEVYILRYGKFYFYKNFIISEINEGEYITKENAKELIDLALGHYGDNLNLSLISNRYNNQEIKYEDWETFYKEGFQLKALAIVTYDKSDLMNFMIEKNKFHDKIRNFYSLENAVKWISSVD